MFLKLTSFPTQLTTLLHILIFDKVERKKHIITIPTLVIYNKKTIKTALMVLNILKT
jgi:hypothetical protein